MTRLPGISGSLRVRSSNAAQLRAAQAAAVGGVQVDDGLSRPTTGLADLFKDRRVVVIGASPGGFGTTASQNHWPPVLRSLGVRRWSGGRLLVSRAGAALASNGSLQDDAVRHQLAECIRGFAVRGCKLTQREGRKLMEAPFWTTA